MLQQTPSQQQEGLEIKLQAKRKSHEPSFPTEEKFAPDSMKKRPSTRNGHQFITPQESKGSQHSRRSQRSSSGFRPNPKLPALPSQQMKLYDQRLGFIGGNAKEQVTRSANPSQERPEGRNGQRLNGRAATKNQGLFPNSKIGQRKSSKGNSRVLVGGQPNADASYKSSKLPAQEGQKTSKFIAKLNKAEQPFFSQQTHTLGSPLPSGGPEQISLSRTNSNSNYFNQRSEQGRQEIYQTIEHLKVKNQQLKEQFNHMFKLQGKGKVSQRPHGEVNELQNRTTNEKQRS